MQQERLVLIGNGMAGVRTLEELLKLEPEKYAVKKRCSPRPSPTNAVVIGGGLLGLEAASGLLNHGMKVTVIHLMDVLMDNPCNRRGVCHAQGGYNKANSLLFPRKSPSGPRDR
jgi:NAD(P)H-nitrite reductase large subunit